MSKSIETILADASELSVEDRELLIHDLLSQLDPTPVDEIDHLQRELIERRYREIIEGRVKGMTAEESDARISARLNEKS